MSRVAVLKLFFLAFGLAIAGRTIQLQIGSDPRLEKLANRQFQSKVTSLPRRGLIFDRNGDSLAISLKVRSLFFRPELLRKEQNAKTRSRNLGSLSKILHIPGNTLIAKAGSEKGFVWVKRQLSEQEEKAIRDRGFLEYGDGIGLAEETKRFYPNKDLASHVLGSVNVDGQGIEGLELFYEGILNGESARISSNKDAMGRRIFRDDKGLLAIKDGQTLVLTLDKAIQYETEKALKQAIDENQAKAGTAIVAEVESGEILAMANFPTFNPNNPKHATQDSRRNRAITDTYEPGSTFKPLIVALALEKGKPPKTQIYCEKGSFKVGDRKISEAEAHEKYEWLTFGEILKYSSNIGAAKLALDLGANNIAQLADRLGIGRKTQIDLPGEVNGSIPLKDLRSPVRLANIGFGHGITVTPLQMLTYYLAFANGGKWIQPKLVKAIFSEDPDSLEKGNIRWRLGHRFDSLNSKKLFSPTVARQITAMLESVVQEGGTGTKAQLEEWPVAGKTGTAQKIDSETKRYSRSKHITSFLGYAPAKNPKLVALVLIDEPQKKLYASETAAPAFRDIMRAALLREKVPSSDARIRTIQLANRTLVEDIKQTENRPTEVSKPEKNDQAQVKLPDLRGLSIREAVSTIGDQPLELEIIGSGILKEQNPPADQWINAGGKVRLHFEEK